MKKITYFLLILGLLFTANDILAQQSKAGVSGYRGKRFMLKVDPTAFVIQKGWLTDFEFIAGRYFVASVFLSTSDRPFTQKLENYRQVYGYYPTQKGNFKDFQFGLKGRYYFLTKYTAPIGAYFYGSYAQGKSSIDGLFYDGRANQFLQYNAENVTSRKFTLGIGNEIVAFNMMTLNFDFGFTMGRLRLNEDVSLEQLLAMNAFANSYGPNVYSFSGARNGYGGLGLSANLRLGFLLF